MEVKRVCTQGDIDLPIIFNIIVDAVIRTWKGNEEFKQRQSYFYGNDGLLENTNYIELQKNLDYLIKLFGRVGLKANETKTKFMVISGTVAPTAMTTKKFNRS